uniref:Zinc finger HIT domain-containing protein 3 n=1 Tax=Strigamia maritima TaxID=126957 RepID=T1JGH9_STRMM
MAPTEESFNTFSVVKSKICQVCTRDKSKYKCSTCEIPYCSLTCYKQHKLTPCAKLQKFAVPIEISDVNTENNENDENKLNFDEDRVDLSEEILENLGRSNEVKDSLCNSDLRKILLWINNSKDPRKAIHTAMMEPIFVDFVDGCLNVVEKNDINEEMSE